MGTDTLGYGPLSILPWLSCGLLKSAHWGAESGGMGAALLTIGEPLSLSCGGA